MIDFYDIEKANNRIKRYIWETPLDPSMAMSCGDMKVFLKLENQQRLKNFKVRGALSKLTGLSERENR